MSSSRTEVHHAVIAPEVQPAAHSRSKFIRLPPASKAAWPEASRWLCWPASSAFCRTAASGIRSICWRRLSTPIRFSFRMDYLTSFHAGLFLVASLLHIVTSLLVGLLYGVMLPMFPRRPDFAGRSDRSLHVVGPALCHSRHHQSAAEPEDRLEMVRRVADRLRHCGRSRCGAARHACAPGSSCRSRCARGLKLRV